RGSIITPLKDRIESQILTHYPTSLDIAKEITRQEAKFAEDQTEQVHISEMIRNLLERIAFKARESEFVDEKSGVSARLTISGMENLVSTAERRALINGEVSSAVRIMDFWGMIPAITGKVELVYEGEQEGPYNVALALIGEAIKEEFLEHFPHPERLSADEDKDPYGVIRTWFGAGNTIDLYNDSSNKELDDQLTQVAGLDGLIDGLKIDDTERPLYKEFLLHGLAEFNVLTKDFVNSRFSFGDLLADMFGDGFDD
ncbi:MAG: magnesium chelatase, partial [Bacteroidota bacterium]